MESFPKSFEETLIGFKAPNNLHKSFLPPNDPRMYRYPLVHRVKTTISFCVIYALISYFWRKQIITKQKSEKKIHEAVKTIITRKEDSSYGVTPLQCFVVLYNVVMVILNSYLVIQFFLSAYEGGTGLGCKPYDYSLKPFILRQLAAGYIFHISKFLECFDTFFFLIRKKPNQVTFLHVFHHAHMPLLTGLAIKYSPEGMIYLFPLANSFIHVLMYTYYGLAAAGLYRYLWWKHYLTIAQMLQFVLMIVHQGQIFVLPNNCDYPRAFPAAICTYSLIFLVLFGNFYIQAYTKKRRTAKVYNAKAQSNGSISNKTANEHVEKKLN